MVRPSQRVEMAKEAVANGALGVRQSCMAFSVSECCYRYERRLSDENMLVAELLLGLTQSQRNWGVGLCFLYLRNVKGYRWNHKRVYRIYRELELNLRIRPRRRLKREKPGAACRTGGHKSSMVNGLYARSVAKRSLYTPVERY